MAGPLGAARGRNASGAVGVSRAGPRRRQPRAHAIVRGRAPALPGSDKARRCCPPDALRALLAALSAPCGPGMSLGASCEGRRLPRSAPRRRWGASHGRAVRRTASPVYPARARAHMPT